MKIVHICLNGPVTDGWNYQDNILPKYHKKMGYDVTLIASQWVWGTDGKLKKYVKSGYINSDGVKIIRLPIKGKDDFNRKFKIYENLSGVLDDEKPDILFVHGINFLDTRTIVRFCERNQGITMYVDNHMDYWNSATNWLSKNILHRIVWKHHAHLLLPYTDKFYGVLPARVDFLTELYKLPKGKCELLVMGADDERVLEAKKINARKKIRDQYRIAEDDFLIMTGGKIDKWKKQTLLLMDAVKKIDNPKVKLIVFGSVAPELQDKMNELTDGTNVQYIGWVQSEESYKYFAAADLVVFPGRHSVFWEQVAGQGIPMLVKYWEGTTHVDLGGNVEFLYKDSVDEIRGKIETIIEEPGKYGRMKKVAEERGMEVFSYQKIAKLCIQK